MATVWWPVCQKWGLLINSLLQASSSSGDDQSCIFHNLPYDTIIFWKWDKSIWLFIPKEMFDAVSSKYCHCPDYISNKSLMAQLTGLRYFSRKNFGSDTSAFYLRWNNLQNCGAGNFCFFCYISEISISSFPVKAGVVVICSLKHFTM